MILNGQKNEQPSSSPIVLHFTYHLLTRRVNETLQSLVEMNLIFILHGVVLE